MQKKRKYEEIRRREIKRKGQRVSSFLPEGSSDEVLEVEVAELLESSALSSSNNGVQSVSETMNNASDPSNRSKTTYRQPSELGEEVELEIIKLSSTGDGLAYNEAKDHVFTVPFSVPGDRVLAKPWKWQGQYTVADFISVVRPSPDREGTDPKCGYFTKCAGCQFQMLPYEKHLELKQDIVERAFKNFSSLSPDQIPQLEPTMGSPLQYGYRTKLSPHFSGPHGSWKKTGARFEACPPIGFHMKGRSRVMDIESCPIGADILQEGLKIERAKVEAHFDSYHNGATILLRESTSRGHSKAEPGDLAPHDVPADHDLQPISSSTVSRDPLTDEPSITITYPTHTDVKTYVTDERAQATEYITTTIDPDTVPPTTRTYRFSNIAGAFFQNNNSILGPFTSYIYGKCKPRSNPATDSSSQSTVKYLLDAYSGSGLFTLTLSTHFISSLGIDVDQRSIAAARNNAGVNDVQNAGFIDADASALFADVPYPPHETVVVIDPPRKGCDRPFLNQLRRYGPKRVIYVSCNVHSQARDVGILVNGFKKDARSWYGGRGLKAEDMTEDEEWEEQGLWKYEIESLRGFDFFPQTGHVEGVCVLNRVEEEV